MLSESKPMRRLYSQSNIDNTNTINHKPTKSGQDSLDSSFTLSQQNKSLEKNGYRKFESLDKNVANLEKNLCSESSIPEAKDKMLDTLQFLTLPSIRPTNDSENKFFGRVKKLKQNLTQSVKSSSVSHVNQKQQDNVIFYHHTQTKEVSLQKLKDKSSSYKRLHFKKKNQYGTCQPQQLQKIINAIYKNSSSQAKSIQLISNKSSSRESLCKSNEIIRDMLHSASETRRSRKISFRQSSLKEPQVQDNQNLKKITESSFEHENPSKEIFNQVLCPACGANNSQILNNGYGTHKKYEKLQKVFLGLKNEYIKLVKQLELFEQNMMMTINQLCQASEMGYKIKQQNFSPSKIQKLKPEAMKQYQVNSQFSDCFQIFKNFDQDLNEDASVSFISKNTKVRPFEVDETNPPGQKISKKESFKFQNDISFSSIRSVGKIVKNVKRQIIKTNQKLFQTLVNNEINGTQIKNGPDLKENVIITSSQNFMNSSAKSPQSPPTKEPLVIKRVPHHSMKLTLNQKNDLKAQGKNLPLTSRGEEKLNLSTYSVANSRCTRRQSKSCYQNIKDALSRIKQSLA